MGPDVCQRLQRNFGNESSTGKVYKFWYFQIGGKWAVTAAHCVHDKSTGQLLEASLLQIILGLLDKTKTETSQTAK